MFNVSSITNSNASQMAANIAVSASSKLTTIFHATVKPAAYAAGKVAFKVLRGSIIVLAIAGFALLIHALSTGYFSKKSPATPEPVVPTPEPVVPTPEPIVVPQAEVRRRANSFSGKVSPFKSHLVEPRGAFHFLYNQSVKLAAPYILKKSTAEKTEQIVRPRSNSVRADVKPSFVETLTKPRSTEPEVVAVSQLKLANQCRQCKAFKVRSTQTIYGQDKINYTTFSDGNTIIIRFKDDEKRYMLLPGLDEDKFMTVTEIKEN